jgi:hypothetical protein
MRIFLISSTTLVWDGAEDGVASCAHLNCHSTGSDGAGGARCLIGSGGGIGADLGGAEWRRKRGCKVRKCIEERGKTFLHLLSPQRQNALLTCLLCWSIFFSCTLTCVLQICFYIPLLSQSNHTYSHPITPRIMRCRDEHALQLTCAWSEACRMYAFRSMANRNLAMTTRSSLSAHLHASGVG